MDNSLQSCIDGEHADFLAIDDLLDFSNDDIGGPIGSSCLTIATSESRTPSVEVPKLSSIVSSPREKKHVHQTPCVFDSDQLCVPCDDLAELEWLSNFVEESFSSGDNGPASFCFGSMVGKFATDDSQAHRESLNDSFQSTSPVSVLESNAHSREKALSFTGPDTSVPARARSKRCRTGVCFWNTQILSAEASESILESTSTTNSTITSDSDMINTYYDHDDDDYNYNDDNDDYGDDDNDDETDGDRHRHYHQHNRVGDRSFKTKKFNKAFDSFSNSSKPKKVKAQDGCQVVRKCLHCATQKTPQWRAGPMGPKTLCNACGVRYKSGRLCAEYRPAASPTFIENVHSNSHRKVLEMRRQRGDFMSPSSMRHEKPQCRLDRGGAGVVHLGDK